VALRNGAAFDSRPRRRWRRSMFPRLFILLAIFGASAAHLSADTVFTQPPSAAGGLIPSSWCDPQGTDADMYAYDNFTLTVSQTITAVHWRGGYQYGGIYGRLFNFSIAFYGSIAGGSEPNIVNPQLPEIYLAWYDVGGTAGETLFGNVGGIDMYDYSYTLPTPFVATAGTPYWIKIEASQPSMPDWGIALGTGGDNRHFAFSTGAARFYFSGGDAAFDLLAAAVMHGDMNCDGVVNFADINPFVMALSDPAGYHAAYPNCNVANGDINSDGQVNFADINFFVALLSHS
jgi:hypothetical protein